MSLLKFSCRAIIYTRPHRIPLSRNEEAAPDSNSSKAYHVTAEWGKRGMTLQELTRAFDAFNEAEERVAIGFAGSEGCNRKLAEPLSEVKTMFLDLDGLKPRSGCSSVPPTSSAAFLSRQVVSHVSQVNPDINTRNPNELGCLLANDVSRRGNARMKNIA
ncbi:hypothetical protein JB92DRAFT_3123375 [Gautieria morchelliformis]|nr:hypothetical protein JB92DRAFT_3123375 [Gautieria morchelliformis]